MSPLFWGGGSVINFTGTVAYADTFSANSLVTITEDYTFISDNSISGKTISSSSKLEEYFDDNKVYFASNATATNKGSFTLNDTTYYNSLKLKSSGCYAVFKVGAGATVTVYHESHASRVIAAGSTEVGATDVALGSVNTSTTTFSVTSDTTVYLTAVSESDTSSGGDVYLGAIVVDFDTDPSVTLLDPQTYGTSAYTLDGEITAVTEGAEDLTALPDTVLNTGYKVENLNGATITDSTINVIYGSKAYALNPTDSTVKAWISDNGMAIMQAFGDVVTGIPAVAKAVVTVSDGETTETLETDATVEFVTWDFVNSGTINSQYSAGEFTSSGVTLAYDTTNGKLNNESGNGWCQFNAGTTLTVPVFEGSTISWTLYSTDHKIKIGDTEYSSIDTYTATETGTVTLESVGGDGVQCYISTLTVTY